MALSLSTALELWRIDLAGPGLEELADRSLCPAERARAARIVSPDRRALWARSRGALRGLLGQYVGCDPGELVFTIGPYGKPALAGEVDLRFNLSHSGELMLVAVSDGVEVGVDVERARERYSSAFLREWTVREARAKCIGTGLSHARDRGGDGMGRGDDLGEDRDGELWAHELDLGPGAFGAVAVSGGALGADRIRLRPFVHERQLLGDLAKTGRG